MYPWIRKYPLLLVLLSLGAVNLHGQTGQQAPTPFMTTLYFNGVPVGGCQNTQLAINTVTGDLYDCNIGAWHLVGSGSGSGGLAFVASLPATCTPGVTASVQLSVTPYLIYYCDATNHWSATSLPAGPTTPNITWPLTVTTSGGVAGAPTWSWPGILSSIISAPYTFQDTDRSKYISLGNGGTYTMPDAGGTGFQFGYSLCVLNAVGIAVTFNNTSSSTFYMFGNQTGSALTTFQLPDKAQACFVAGLTNNWEVTITDNARISASATGLGYFNGNDTITSTPPAGAASNNGWKGCYYSNTTCFGVEASAEYHSVNAGNNGWFGVSSTSAPAGNASAGTPDTNFGTAMSTAGAFWAKEAVACNGGLTNVASGYYLCADTTTHEWQGVTNGAATSSSGMLARVRSGAISSGDKTGPITTATLCAATTSNCNQAGDYTVEWNFIQTGTACTTNTTGGVTFLLTWTDRNGTAHNAVQLAMDDSLSLVATTGTFHFNQTGNGLGTVWASGNFNISSNGSIIQYATGFAQCSVSGTATYQLDAWVTRKE